MLTLNLQDFQLPLEIVAIITLVTTFLVAQGIKGFMQVFDIDLSGKAAAFTAVVVGAIVFFINGFVGMFPPETQETVLTILQALALIFGIFGVHKVYKGIGARDPPAG